MGISETPASSATTSHMFAPSRFKNIFLTIAIVILTAKTGEQANNDGSSAMYCSSESFDVSCGHNEVILMDSAFYGRMHSGRCVSSDYTDSLGCYVDVLQYMDNQCSGKQKCKMLVATLEAVTQPCKKDFKSYLEAKHICVPVDTPRLDRCQTAERHLLAGSSGYITSGIVDQLPLPVTCRWSIRVRTGQSVSISLLSFDLLSMEDWIYTEGGGSEVGRDACTVDVLVTEGHDVTRIDVCGVKQREEVVFTSEISTISLDVAIHRRAKVMPRFILKYKAVGCADLAVSDPSAFVQRKGEHVFVRCNETNETWFLTCRDEKWIGEVGNCSSAARDWNSERVAQTSSTFHKGWIVFAIIIGIVLGLLVGTSLLTIALMWRKRNREDASSSSQYHTEEAHSGTGNASMRASYPALLRQEKPLGEVSEYTHVWEVHPPVLCHEGFPPPHQHHHTCKMAELNALNCANSLNRDNTYSSSRESGYSGSVADDKHIIIPRNIPLYFDMDHSGEGEPPIHLQPCRQIDS